MNSTMKRMAFILIALTISIESFSQLSSISENEYKISQIVIEGYDEVQDSDVRIEDGEVWLIVIVRYATNEATAKRMGDNFLRNFCAMVKAEKCKPSKEIGKTTFNYRIGVFYPNEKQVALGYKSAGAHRIIW